MGLKDAEDLAAGDALNKGDTVLVTEQDADLRRHLTLLRRLRDHLLHLPGEPKHASTSQISNPTKALITEAGDTRMEWNRQWREKRSLSHRRRQS